MYPGFELRLHLSFFHRAGVDVAVCVDEARHGRHAFGIDDSSGRCSGSSGSRRDNLPCPHDDGSALNDGSIGDNDAGVRDGEVLRIQRSECSEEQAGD